jgi:hypothetical protein
LPGILRVQEAVQANAQFVTHEWKTKGHMKHWCPGAVTVFAVREYLGCTQSACMESCAERVR